jgi:prevent-host-death family protein
LILAIFLTRRKGGEAMRFASVAEVRNQLSTYLAQATKDKKPIVVMHHGRPYALIQPISEGDLEVLGWGRLARNRLQQAREREDDAHYDYL